MGFTEFRGEALKVLSPPWGGKGRISFGRKANRERVGKAV